MGRVLFFLFCTLYFSFFSQIGPRVWQDHTSLNRCNSVTKLGSKIYAANSIGVVRLDEAELAPEAITKINGLSDVGVRLVRNNPNNNRMMVIYDNCNIDVVDINENITNYADFKLKAYNGKKIINEVTFYNQFAYLATGFGIVLFDTEKMEVKETFIIGPGGAYLEVYQVALNDSLIFAATPSGIFRSNFKTRDLTNFHNWALDTTFLPAGPYAGIASAQGKIITAYSPYKLNPLVTKKDTFYIFDNNAWSKFQPANTGYTIKKFCMSNGEFFSVIDDFGFRVASINTGNLLTYITSFNANIDFQPTDLYFGKDYLSNTSFWCADLIYGLYQTYSSYPYPQNKVSRNGMNNPLVNSIDVYQGKVAVSPSHPDAGGGSIYTDQGLNILEKGEWSYLKFNDLANSRVLDLTYVFIDRKDTTKMWASSWFNGLLEFKHKKLINVYTPANSPMSEVAPGNPRCSGIDMDSDGNLWFANSDVPNYLTVRKKSGAFQTFNFGTARFTRKILVDRNNYVWALHERDGGITVFRNDNFASPVSGYNYKVLTKDVNNGNLQSNSIYAITEDNDGKIWVGTGTGVVVFYNPTSIFSNGNFDAQPIKIVQDGNVELLLGDEVVTSIAVDGANNKWMGTETGGVYCFSSDGITQIYHFTAENSPLYSNYVIDINYDESTGDVFFGTDIGLQSYRGIIVKGEDAYTNVHAYPNPVRPNYRGTVLINGLVDNSIVKIVDESGNIVWEGKSYGGQIEWNIATFSNSRVKPGVYIVYAATTTADQKAVTKILVVN